MKININNICKSIRSGNEKEKENSINLVISILESKDEIDEESQSAIQDCISAITEVATKPEIDNRKYPIARFFRTVTGDNKCVLCENDISTLLEGAIQSNTNGENYKSVLKIINIITLNQPSALVSHRDKLKNVLSGISDNTVDIQELQWGLETVAKLSSFDESFMPIAVGLFTEALETEPHSHPTHRTIRGATINSLFRNHMEPEPEPWDVCFRIDSILSTIDADDTRINGRARELLNYFFEVHSNKTLNQTDLHPDQTNLHSSNTMTEMDFHALSWLDFDWSNWKLLNANSFSEMPKEPGLYRIRHKIEDRNHLKYIGESSDTRRRIQSLARGVYAEEMPYRDPHTAAPCLWAVRDNVGSALEVSHTTPPKAEDEQHRKGIEAALIALHRRETNRSPTANFGRIIDGYKQSSYSYSNPAYKGGRLESGEEELNSASGVKPPDWQNWREPLARDWMGLDWSEPYQLAERLDTDPPDTGVYRIWYEGQDSTLAYIGESSNISSRLYNHEQTFGQDALFAYAERSDLDASHKRAEIETDLIGAYYLKVREAPLAQFGHTENVPA